MDWIKLDWIRPDKDRLLQIRVDQNDRGLGESGAEEEGVRAGIRLESWGIEWNLMSFSCRQKGRHAVVEARISSHQAHRDKSTRTQVTHTHTIRCNSPYTATLIPRQDDEAVLPPMSPMCSVFYAIAPAGARHRRHHAHDGIPVVGKRGHVDMGTAV